MLETHMLNPDGYQAVVEDGKNAGFSFQMRIPYYRGITLSILRDIQVTVDGKQYPREALTVTINDETFTLEEMRTVIHNRWLFGQFGTVTVHTDDALAQGHHDLSVTVIVAPSYMPFQLVKTVKGEFAI